MNSSLANPSGPGSLRLTRLQKILIQANLPSGMAELRKYELFSLLEAIFFVVKTGCQWNMLPGCYPPVEAFFSWLSNYRRLARNYEKYTSTARAMTVIACLMFMLRFFR